ncbi:MAG TPA: alginate lyase family protein, partial [Limnochordia bacterium]|nr:alginate lyase family protein [Limnochordia bacterium]
MVDATLRTQILPDGVQHEFAPGYHAGCTRMLAEMGALAQRVGADVPASFRETLDKMATYVLAMVTPEFSNPMFGDTRRPEGGRTYGELLVMLGGILNRPEFSAVAERRHAGLPPLNWCFPHGGMYFFRSGWGPDDIYMALHCCPPSAGGKKGGHDQPDNGTFELCAFGRWLMPDSGCFVYHESTAPLDRDWFRQTAVHQTLTLDNANSVNAPRHLFWWDTPELAVVRFENQSYPDLCHRRTVFFVQRRFFVIVDEALGDARGDLDLHVQLAPGPAQIDAGSKTARTEFADGGNVLVWTPAVQAARMEEEAGYTSSRYGHYEPRPAFRLRLADGPPAALLSVIVPYRGAKPPRVVAALEPGFVPGADSLAVRCEVDNAAVVVGCDGRRAWLES